MQTVKLRQHTTKKEVDQVNIQDLDLRQAILYKLSDSSTQDIEETIQDAVRTGDEKTLPGLGVLFELYWQQCNDSHKQEVIGHIHDELQQSEVEKPV